jgi:hypothetical protein
VKSRVARLLLTAGALTPEQAALLLSVGLVLGVFPIVGIPTVLCAAAAFGLRLNPVALQLVNNIFSPLQWALLLPLARIGGRIFGRGPGTAAQLLAVPLHAITGWACICIPFGILFYFVLLFALRRRRRVWFNRLETPA